MPPVATDDDAAIRVERAGQVLRVACRGNAWTLSVGREQRVGRKSFVTIMPEIALTVSRSFVDDPLVFRVCIDERSGVRPIPSRSPRDRI